jgi:hypothetical protein
MPPDEFAEEAANATGKVGVVEGVEFACIEEDAVADGAGVGFDVGAQVGELDEGATAARATAHFAGFVGSRVGGGTFRGEGVVVNGQDFFQFMLIQPEAGTLGAVVNNVWPHAN